MGIIKRIDDVLVTLFSGEEIRHRVEWYRKEITKAFEDKDYERTRFLERESERH